MYPKNQPKKICCHYPDEDRKDHLRAYGLVSTVFDSELCGTTEPSFKMVTELYIVFRSSIVCSMIAEKGTFWAFVWQMGALHENMFFPACQRETLFERLAGQSLQEQNQKPLGPVKILLIWINKACKNIWTESVTSRYFTPNKNIGSQKLKQFGTIDMEQARKVTVIFLTTGSAEIIRNLHQWS